VQSNNFDTTWSKAGSTLVGGQSGYDGSSDAWLLESPNTGQSSVIQSISQSGVQTASVYAKAGTTDWMFLYLVGSPDKNAWFNLSNGTLGNINGIDSSIESVGNNWYRCSVSYDTTISMRIYISNGNNSVHSALGANIYIQDAQLNQGLVAMPYLPTTTTTSVGGILANLPRIDYTGGGCGSLLLEPSRSNLVPYSEYNFSVSGGNSAIEYNNTISPEGYQNAFKLIATSTFNAFFRISVSTASASNISLFVKNGNHDWIQVTTNNLTFNFNKDITLYKRLP
jgi:hypothetical protein